jgi:hypothetical protein
VLGIALLARRAINAAIATTCVFGRAIVDALTITANLTVPALVDTDPTTTLLTFGTGRLARASDRIKSLACGTVETFAATADAALALVNAFAVLACLAGEVAELCADPEPALLAFGTLALRAAVRCAVVTRISAKSDAS